MKLFLIFILTLSSVAFGQKELSPEKFNEAVSQPGVQLLDVRTYQEYLSGYIENTMQADWNNQDEFQTRIQALDKSKPVYIYCLSGGRSAAAQEWMLKNGFTSVTNLKGGIAAWNKAKLDLIVEMVAQELYLDKELAKYDPTEKILVDVGASYCPPCRKMQPIVDELKAEKYVVINVDGGEQKQICEQYHVAAFPTFIVFQNGEEIARKEGVATKEELKKLLE